MKPIPMWPWGTIGLVTVPIAIAALITYGRVSGFVIFGDAEWYATGASALLRDGPLYDPSKLGTHEFGLPPYWNQPPSTALFALLTALPGERWLWGSLMVVSLLVGLGLIWPRVGLGGDMLLLPAMLVWLPISSALTWANINALVFALLALALRFPRFAGWAIGIAAAAKLVPILGVAWLLGKRDWRGAMVAASVLVAATLVVLVWKGPSTITDFVALRLHEITPPGDRPRWNPVELLGLPDWIAYLAAAGTAVIAVRRASFSLSIIAMLLSVPALHAHYLIWALIPFMAIWVPSYLRWTHHRCVPNDR